MPRKVTSLALDGEELGHGFPRRPIELPELSAILTHPSCTDQARDRVWCLLVQHAQTGDQHWRIGSLGVALPVLQAAVRELPKPSGANVEMILVQSFLEALDTTTIREPHIFERLFKGAFLVARRTLQSSRPKIARGSSAPKSTLPRPPCSHPDVILARAVRQGLLTAEEAELIGATYLEDVSLAAYAVQIGEDLHDLAKRRGAAVTRLVAALNVNNKFD